MLGRIAFNDCPWRTAAAADLPNRRKSNLRRCAVITMGIGTIMDARAVLLLAFGENKADAVAGAVEGPISASNPASILQMHPTAKIFLDEKSTSMLARRNYYLWVFENKPEWQRD
jgi:glucosamine-6-phosphate deaminase